MSDAINTNSHAVNVLEDAVSRTFEPTNLAPSLALQHEGSPEDGPLGWRVQLWIPAITPKHDDVDAVDATDVVQVVATRSRTQPENVNAVTSEINEPIIASAVNMTDRADLAPSARVHESESTTGMETSAISASEPTTGTGEPMTGTGESTTGTGESTTGAGEPMTAAEPSRVVDSDESDRTPTWTETETHVIGRYRQPWSGPFRYLERWRDKSTDVVHWRTVSVDGITTIYGRSRSTRIVDTNAPSRVVAWLAEESRDDQGSVILYRYGLDDCICDQPMTSEEHRRLVLDVRPIKTPGERVQDLFESTGGGPRTEVVDVQRIQCDVLNLRQHCESDPKHAIAPLTTDALGLQFRVSLDEEHIELSIKDGGRMITMPSSTIWYTLLTLARTRALDQQHGLVDTEAGWMDVPSLQSMLKISPDVLNHHVARARKAFKAVGVRDFKNMIERHRRGKIRLGVRRLEIIHAYRHR